MMPSDADHVARALMTLVADAAVRALALACVMGLAIVVLRRQRASAQLSAWTVVLVAALALPVLAIVLPAWRWSVPAMSLDTWVPTTLSASGREILAASPRVAQTREAAWSWPSGMVVAAAIYLAGVLWFSFRACLAWLSVRRLRFSARTIADSSALARLKAHAAVAGLTSAPRLVESADLFVPVTMSVLRPIVVLPDDWREWPAGKLDAVLIHEVAHVARRDALTQRVSLFYRAVFWFSPLSWWLHRRLSDLGDQASDEAALDAGIDPATYAGALVDFFAQLHKGPRRAEWHVAMARRADADAARRVERILSWKGGSIMTRSKVLVAVAILVTAPVVALTASVRLASDMGPAFTTPRLSMDRAVAVAPPVNPPAIAANITQAPAKTRSRPAPPANTTPSVADGLAALGAALDQAKPASPPTPQVDDFAKGAYEAGKDGVTWPKVITAVKPKYTPDAMRAKIQGTVTVEVIVLPDGAVGKARVKPLPDGSSSVAWRIDGGAAEPFAVAGQLVEAALEAARQWTFTPGTLNGKAVSVLTVIELEFRLH